MNTEVINLMNSNTQHISSFIFAFQTEKNIGGELSRLATMNSYLMHLRNSYSRKECDRNTGVETQAFGAFSGIC
jgi:hypothetical protein